MTENALLAAGLPAAKAPGYPTRLLVWALIPVAVASGFAGLGYEVVWTRLLSQSLGTEMMAVLGVVAGFFAGLATGAFALDGWIRRARSPFRAYALLEAAIGVWAVASIWLLPWAGRQLPPLLGTEPPRLLLWAASFALPAITLLPATVAMGGTLTALERMIGAASVRGRGQARRAALTYGANTAGAVLGTLAAVTVLIPGLGLSGTLSCLALLNAACALAALRLHTVATPMLETEDATQRTRGDTWLTAQLLVSGLLGIAFEVLIVRLAAQVLQDTIFTFAALLAAYLAGTAVGGLAWQVLGRRVREPAPAWLVAATALVCLGTAWAVPMLAELGEELSWTGLGGELTVAAGLFFLPAAMMGALFSSLAQAVRDQRGSLGWAVGVNSVGAGLAPLLVSLVLIPSLGAWPALVPVSAAYLLLARPRPRAVAWLAAPAIVAVALWAFPAPSLVRVMPGGRLLTVREGPMATASVVDDASGARYLEVNGHFRMGGTNSVRSDYRQAMLPLLLHPFPKRAVFMGVGTGATLAGGGRVPGVDVHGVELSPEVAELLPWFVDAPGAPPTPMPPVVIADARRYALADTRLYDVIIADLFHPALDGSGSLYTVEHFRTVRDRLAGGGIFCQWLPLYQLDAPSLRTIMRGFLDVFPNASAWLAHFSVGTPMLALVGRTDAGSMDLPALQARLSDPATAAAVGPVGFARPIDVLGQFLGGPRSIAAFAGEGPRNTDDFPFVALDAVRNVRALRAPPYTLLLTVLTGLRPDAAELLPAPAGADLAARLDAYWRARDTFIRAGAAIPPGVRGSALVAAAAPGLLDAIRMSPEFDFAYMPLLSMARSLAAGDRAGAVSLLRRIDAAAPSRPEARALLTELGAS